MLFFTIALLVAADPVDCPPKGTAMGDRLRVAGEICKDDVVEQAANRRASANFASRGNQFADRALPVTMQAAIRRKMDDVLLDGASARYRWPLWKHPDIYCFQVNAKNRMGGYVGWDTYAVTILPGGKVGDPTEPYDCPNIG